jgi:Tfp pilus assembly protein PilV
MNPSSISRHRQRGTTLLEALVAFLVVTLGMLSVARVQTQMRQHAELAQQRAEAVRLAQEEIESLRAFAVLAASTGARSFDAIANDSHTVAAAVGAAMPTPYLVTREIDATVAPRAKNALVTVGWVDRSGSAQQVALGSVIAGTDPAFGGALALARTSAPARGGFGRSVRIPLAAKDLGDGRSALKPISNGTLAFVFDNTTGLISKRCDHIDPATLARDLSLANLGACTAVNARLLSGSVRFSSASPPNASRANDLPLALGVSITLTGGDYPTAPSCSAEPMKTVSFAVAGSPRIEAVPIAATAAGYGVPAWVESGDRFVAYHCLITPMASGHWSGRSLIEPSGWTIGNGATDHRVCRYTADLDASGAIDSNLEHPADYTRVDAHLAHQNFLVVKGSEACPAGRVARFAGNNAGSEADAATAPHPP